MIDFISVYQTQHFASVEVRVSNSGGERCELRLGDDIAIFASRAFLRYLAGEISRAIEAAPEDVNPIDPFTGKAKPELAAKERRDV